MDNDHGRGKIKDNALAALVTSRTFKCKVEKPKKGKGAKYTRNSKHKGSSFRTDEPFEIGYINYIKLLYKVYSITR